MRKWILYCFLLGLNVSVFAGNNHIPSPVGLWLATSPLYFSRPLAIVKLYMKKDVLCGELVKVLPLNGKIPNAGIANSGPIMMCGYTYQDGVWKGGMIYEQITAMIYPSEVKLSQDGRSMTVRAWKGIFSRSVQWKKLK